MIAGAALGIALNVTAGTASVTLSEGLPAGLDQVAIDSSTSRTEIRTTDNDGAVATYAIDPASADPDAFRSLASFRDAHPELAELYVAQGRSPAQRYGEWFRRLGNLFLRMLQMVAVPLIVTSLITGIMGLGGSGGIGRMFQRTLFYYVSTSMLAIITGIFAVNMLRPGLREGIVAPPAPPQVTEASSLGAVLFDQVEAMIPANPAAALVEPNFLSIIAFTLAFAIFAIRVGGTTAERVHSAAEAGFAVMMALTTAIIRLAPIGIFFLMLSVTSTQGASVFTSLGWYMLAVVSALSFHAVITLPLIVWLVAKRSPWKFARAMSPALLTAFSSASSNGTLPLTIASAEERAGISNRTSSFVLPLGATVNMDGTALYEAVAVLFIAQLHFGQNLELTQQLIVAFTALLASVGAAGIPHAGLVMMVIILQAVNLPLEMQGIILAVDRVLDMSRTTVNVWSDACGCAVVDALENQTPNRTSGFPA